MTHGALKVVAFILVPAWIFGQGPAAGAPPTEADFVEALLQRDAAAAAGGVLRERLRSAELARRSAPEWRIEGLREESTSDSTAFTTDALSLGVSFDLTPANDLTRERAGSEAAATRGELTAELVGEVVEFRRLLQEAWRAERRHEILEGWQRHMDQVLRELTRLVEQGEHADFDLRRLRSLAANHRAATRMEKASMKAAAVQVRSLTGLGFEGVELPAPPPLEDPERVLREALASHPVLVALRASLEAEALGTEIAARSHGPKLDLRGGYRRDDMPGAAVGDGYEVEAAFVLPVWSLRKLEIAQARAERASRALSVARAEMRIEAEIRAALERAAAFASIRGVDDEGLQDLLEGSLKRYRSGESTMTELLDVLSSLEGQALLDLETDYARRRARLELDRATGLTSTPKLLELVKERLP